jgi:pilus assembly protein CpaB
MNARQRRGVVLLLVSVLCALAAAAGVYALIRDVQSKVGPERTAYELKKDVPANAALSADQFTKVSVPKRWLPGSAVTELADVRGKVAAGRLHEGSLMQSDMMARRPALEPGQQEIAIMIDAETGVAGKIRPGDRVNIFATFEGDRGSGGKGGTPDQSKVIVSDAEVIDVGRLTPFGEGSGDSGDRDGSTAQRGSGRGAGGDGVPITFALSTLDAQRVAYAESFAEHVRLALVAPGDDGVSGDDRTYTLPGDE